ncbi:MULTISPECIES: urea ABC transporter substrate-binding protein [Sorangium]|uniref:Branched-chain amino acid ABC transporter substrate-binding protein n=1 Tax=Sorangium cellulosum TaxID=56 RepID=A0A4P2QWS1_SORCE|nr:MULTISPECIES: urea ABC transporter substrate-binding protein [Sorangium]AUX34960.1 branched-chain amino acid ABC transporter substrate-binding protein [Sorangium cellulosum]WCQ94267.1 Aliphatic amidase expression-regulating protein [Sorangium sp. Soce836]
MFTSGRSVEERPAAGSFRRRSLCVAAAAVAGAALLSACGNEGKEAPAPGGSPGAAPASDSATIKVGVLHSLSGTMSISEVAVKDATILAIEEINKAGGVLGKQLTPVIEDGASDWPTFNEKARKLVQQDGVAVVFGGWTSASRKAMLPSFEELNGLLFYPVQYEGLEQSPNIFYTGAEPSQQIVPAVDYLLEKGKKRIYLLGSDYVFPRTANKIIKAQLAAKGGELAGEEYLPLGGTEVSTIISKIGAAKPDAIFNTLNGDSNVAFFKQFKDAGYTADKVPVLSVSVAEEEVRGIGADNIAGHLVSWNYYQTTDTPENKKFVEAYKAKYGAARVTDDPIEAGYFGVYLWKMAVEKAKSTEVAKVKEAVSAGGIEYAAPEGLVRLDGKNQHTWKTVRIGKVRQDGLIDEVWSTGKAIQPDPYLTAYPWAKELAAK